MIKGIVRKLDPLGRVVIPKEMRKTLKINEEDLVDIYLKDGVICIESVKLQCVLCGSKEEDKLFQIDGVHICENCINRVKELKG